MSKKNFETKVLNALEWLTSDVSWLKEKVWSLENKMDSNHDRLEELIFSQTDEIKNEINLQGSYINQAFDIITTMQNSDIKKWNKNHFA